MRKQSLFLTFIACLVLVFCLSTPHEARADASSVISDINSYIKSCNDGVQKSLTQRTQDMQAAAHNVLSTVPRIDARVYSCLATIRGLFALNASISNPLDIVGNLIINQILSLVDQVCSMAVSAINQIESSALSLLNATCIPLPGLGLGGINLNLPHLPCNGTNILGKVIVSSPAPPSQSNNPSFLGLGSK